MRRTRTGRRLRSPLNTFGSYYVADHEVRYLEPGPKAGTVRVEVRGPVLSPASPAKRHPPGTILTVARRDVKRAWIPRGRKPKAEGGRGLPLKGGLLGLPLRTAR